MCYTVGQAYRHGYRAKTVTAWLITITYGSGSCSQGNRPGVTGRLKLAYNLEEKEMSSLGNSLGLICIQSIKDRTLRSRGSHPAWLCIECMYLIPKVPCCPMLRLHGKGCNNRLLLRQFWRAHNNINLERQSSASLRCLVVVFSRRNLIRRIMKTSSTLSRTTISTISPRIVRRRRRLQSHLSVPGTEYRAGSASKPRPSSTLVRVATST